MKFIIAIVVGYSFVVAALYVGQRRMQYFPDPTLVTPAQRGLTAFSLEEITTPDGERLVAWFARPSLGKPTILYFQGNAAGLADRYGSYDTFQRAGYGVLALGYRGYSGSTGTPTEEGLLIDARSAVGFLRGRGIELKNMVLFGESLGTGVAIQLAADAATAPGAVVLEAPYTSIVDIAAKRYWFVPVRQLMKDKFDSIRYAPDIKAPVLIFHGANDRLIPPSHSQRLHREIPTQKELYILPDRGHVEELTPELFLNITRFIDRHAGAGTDALSGKAAE